MASNRRIEPDDDARLERIDAAHRFVPLNLYDEVTKLAEYALGEFIEDRNRLIAWHDEQCGCGAWWEH